MTIHIQTARKPHRCDTCGKLIAVGERYWRRVEEDKGGSGQFREHTNCENYTKQPILPAGFNGSRTKIPS